MESGEGRARAATYVLRACEWRLEVCHTRVIWNPGPENVGENEILPTHVLCSDGILHHLHDVRRTIER